MTGPRNNRRWRRGAALGTVLVATAISVPIITAPAADAASYVPTDGVGSSWSANAIDAWRRNAALFGVVVNYTASGSTTGRNNFKDDVTDWAASDIPYGVKDGSITDDPPNRSFAYMPDTAGGTTFMYNLNIAGRRVTNLRLSGSTIAGIFTGKIKQWNDPAIVADNPGLNMPAKPVIPVVRSDGSGSTAQFTQWMVATQGAAWNNYCSRTGRPVINGNCTQTSAYPIEAGSAMIGQTGDLGVSTFVKQPGSDGTIGYVEYSYALNVGFPVAKMLNAAGYYTEPTAGHVAVSLLNAHINMDKSNPATYLTQDLKDVYTNPDARTYPLSSYSYMILPTALDDANHRFNTDKGRTLAAFGQYAVCKGQSQVDALGYSALPINLVQASFDQLKKIPGADVGALNITSCNNPTFSTDGTNTLAKNDPQPQACDKQGPTQCVTGTGGAGQTPTPGKPGTTGTGGKNAAHGAGGGAAGGAAGAAGAAGGGANGANGPGAAGAAGPTAACDPDTEDCGSANNGSADPNTAITAIPVSAQAGLGDNMQVVLMVLAGVLLVALGLGPPLFAQALLRRRNRSGGGQ